ncbi:OmpA family protein [Gilvimarinus sp. DA14]|uniref:MotY family protein n=1 Tax=Gilvimarinus sp. DA14 TaxID=2956798 RepID=UPI0020B8910B|nr:OmpA family protein [Gilvimarinus sp. DA14]UTF61431.1 OmpA family protein [Gilvimarinus sp. DA14]
MNVPVVRAGEGNFSAHGSSLSGKGSHPSKIAVKAQPYRADTLSEISLEVAMYLAVRLLAIASLVMCCAPLWSPAGFAASYSGPMETTRWETNTSVFACTLYQQVPQWGRAVFLHRAGEQQRFYLAEVNRQLAPGGAQWYSLTPAWRAFGQHQLLTQAQVVESNQPVMHDWRESQLLLEQLREGNQLLLRAEPWAARGEHEFTDIVIEPLGFRGALNEFQRCLGSLLPVNYDQIHRSTVHFAGASEEFMDEERELLDNLVRYVLADPYVTSIVIDGHTDGSGLRADNLELSQRRAEFVVNYLQQRGIHEDMLQVRWHGERYPIASNRSEAGRAENRRVTIRVDRFEPPASTVASSSLKN